MTGTYEEPGPTRDEVDGATGAVVLEFGADGCGYCRAAEPLIAAALAEFPTVRRVKVADGKGKPLGRSFGVKLWPTLVFLKDGREVARAVRPTDVETVRRGLGASMAAI
jgi:thioredoxin 1